MRPGRVLASLCLDVEPHGSGHSAPTWPSQRASTASTRSCRACQAIAAERVRVAAGQYVTSVPPPSSCQGRLASSVGLLMPVGHINCVWSARQVEHARYHAGICNQT